jgi:hypothetical protein
MRHSVNAMTVFSRHLFAALLCAALTCAWGCGQDAEQPGVVATVNGRPIDLSQLEFNHDLRGMGLVATENPSVERLRQDYGRIMADLIVRELVFEELAKAGLAVTDEDVSRLESEIRGDYPPEVFDRMLFEENVNPQAWRASLAARVAMEKFADRLTADRAKVELQEAADYYKEHVADFRRPAQVTFLLVRGPEKKLVEKALKERDSGRTFPREPTPDAASIQEVRQPRDMLPPAWRDMLAKLKPGQASPVIQERQEAMALVLVGETPAMTLDPAAAYPLVEKALVEKKRNAAFHDWLAGAMAAADIRISAHLREGGAAAVSEAPAPDILEKEFPGVGDSEGEHASPLADAGFAAKSLADRFPAQTQAPAAASDTNGGPTPSLPSGGSVEPMRLVPGMDGAEDTAPPSPESATTAEPSAPKPAEAAPRANSEASVPAVATPGAMPTTSPVPTDMSVPPGPAPEAPAQAAAVSSPVPAAPTAEKAPPATADMSEKPRGVEFLANKASWVIFTVDDGKEERIYIKGGKTHTVPFTKKLAVKFGSPSDVTYRFGDRQERVESSAREVKTMDFP